MSLSSNCLALGGDYVDVYRPIFFNFLDKTLKLNNINLTATVHTENTILYLSGQNPLYRHKNLWISISKGIYFNKFLGIIKDYENFKKGKLNKMHVYEIGQS